MMKLLPYLCTIVIAFGSANTQGLVTREVAGIEENVTQTNITAPAEPLLPLLEDNEVIVDSNDDKVNDDNVTIMEPQTEPLQDPDPHYQWQSVEQFESFQHKIKHILETGKQPHPAARISYHEMVFDYIFRNEESSEKANTNVEGIDGGIDGGLEDDLEAPTLDAGGQCYCCGCEISCSACKRDFDICCTV